MDEMIRFILVMIFANNILINLFFLSPLMAKFRYKDLAIFSMLTFIVTLSSFLLFAIIFYFFIKPYGLEIIVTITLMAIIYLIAILLKMILQKKEKASILLNDNLIFSVVCIISFGIILIIYHSHMTFFESLLSLTCGLVGLTLAQVIFIGLKEKINDRLVPASFRGLPSYFLLLGILALCFLGIAGMIK